MFTFRPCIDIRHGKVTQIVGSTLRDHSHSQTDNIIIAVPNNDNQSQQQQQPVALSTTTTADQNYVTDMPSSYYANLFRELGLSGGHVIMLSSDEADKAAAILALQTAPNALQVGGGITSENALAYLDAGASHIIVTSALFTHNELDMQKVKDLSTKVGKARLVIDLSCRYQRFESDPDDNFSQNLSGYYVVTNKWQTFTKSQITAELLTELNQYCDEFLIHGVDVEGKKQGIDDNLLELLSRCVTEINSTAVAVLDPAASPRHRVKIAYAGGVRELSDIDRIYELGKGHIDVSIGSALNIYGGHLQLIDIINRCKDLNSIVK